jgi:aspartyl-tRNA(Asn)/glutamyl-tRNA(Gln) amidotransferase subunit C
LRDRFFQAIYFQGQAMRPADWRSSMALDKTAVAQIAALARIRLSETELEPLAAELSHIIGWVEQLAEVDTSNIAPMTSVVAIRIPMRDDAVTDGDCREAILGNAPQSAANGPAKGFFAVPKVVE